MVEAEYYQSVFFCYSQSHTCRLFAENHVRNRTLRNYLSTESQSMNMTRRLYVITARLLLAASLLLVTVPVHAQNWSTVTTTDNSAPDARHESAATVVDGKIYLIGGRGERDVNVYDPVTNTWQTVAEAPLELHHFQPCLLYTSPSPRDQRGSRMPSSA